MVCIHAHAVDYIPKLSSGGDAVVVPDLCIVPQNIRICLLHPQSMTHRFIQSPASVSLLWMKATRCCSLHCLMLLGIWSKPLIVFPKSLLFKSHSRESENRKDRWCSVSYIVTISKTRRWQITSGATISIFFLLPEDIYLVD